MQATVQTPTGIVKTDSGLSFQSIMGNSFPQQQMQYGFNPFQQQMQMPNRIPSSMELQMQMMQNRQPTPFGFNTGFNNGSSVGGI